MYVYLSGGSGGVVYEFKVIDWVAYTVSSVCIVLTQQNFSLMTKNLSSAACQPVMYLSLVFQNLADTFIFGITFNQVQVLGIAISVLGPVIQLARLIINDR